jgi:periplasmic protein TonB
MATQSAPFSPLSSSAQTVQSVLPTLFGEGYGTYKAQRSAFAASYCVNLLVAVVLVWSSHWFVEHHTEIGQHMTRLVTDLTMFDVRAAKSGGGGGGGGDGDKLPATKGAPPKFAREQITPPMVVVRNEQPKLTAEETVVGPPQLVLAKGATGDPYSAVIGALSNGSGSGGGVGTGTNGGVGPGNGRGVGPGSEAGFGNGAYRPGWGGVTAPRAVFAPDPEYSDEARRAKYQGSVLLWLVVGADGLPSDIRVVRSVGLGLDEKALEAVRTWRFQPGLKDGKPVPTQINVEVSFRLY